MTSSAEVDERLVAAYERDGAVLVKDLFRDWVEAIRDGIEHNMASPSTYATENLREGESGRFFDDYCSWTRIEQFEDVIRNSEAAAVAADLMRSQNVQLFHDHVLVKEPGTSKPTPWHSDSPYYFIDGLQTVSFWCPVDNVSAASLRCVAGSHLWPRPVLPTRWVSEADFYPEHDEFMPIPDPDAEGMRILEWEMEAGDAIAFNFRTLHGARGNISPNRRRAFSVRFVGDDARYTARPGPTSPPFPGHNMTEGQRLREDWFPTVFSRNHEINPNSSFSANG